MLPIETLVGIPICLAHSGPAPRVQRALYLLVCRQVTQFAPNLPHADGSRLRPLARGQRWSGPRTYPGQVHCLGRPLVVSLRWTPVGGRPCSSVRRRRCPGLRAFFYPRPLRPVRASAPLRKATTARQPTAHTGDRPRPPLPTGPPSSLSHLISQRDARASTKQSTPGPQPRSRSLSGANGSPGRRRPVGPP